MRRPLRHVHTTRIHSRRIRTWSCRAATRGFPNSHSAPKHATKLAVAPAVEIPPSFRVDDAPQGAVRRPRRLKRRAARPSCDPDRGLRNSLPVELGQPQRRRIPGHVGLVPGEPREPASVGAGRRGREEVVPRGEHPHRAVIHGNRDQIVDRRRTPRDASRAPRAGAIAPGRRSDPRTGPGLARSGAPECARVRPDMDSAVLEVGEPDAIAGRPHRRRRRTRARATAR